MNARKVLKPPLRTAGPMSRNVFIALSSPDPKDEWIVSSLQVDVLIKTRHLPLTRVSHEVVSHVCRVVDTQPHGYDEVDAGHRVYGQPPEVDEAAHIDEGEDHAEQHHHAHRDVLDENDGGEEDAEEGDAHVAPELPLYHLNNLVL